MTANPRPNQDDLNQTSAQRGSDTLHSRVYALLIGFADGFALAVWSFAGSGVTDYLLVIVSGFIFIVVALQLILSCVGRTNEAAAKVDNPPSVTARLGGRRFRDLARPPQRRASRAPRPAAGCRRGGWHDRVRYRFPHRGTWGRYSGQDFPARRLTRSSLPVRHDAHMVENQRRRISAHRPLSRKRGNKIGSPPRPPHAAMPASR